MTAADPRRVWPSLDPAGSSARLAPGVQAWVLAWLRVAVLAAAGAFGLWAATPAAAPEMAPAIAMAHRVDHLKAAFQSGEPAAVQAAVQEVELLRRTYGTLDVQPLVDAMILYARRLGDQGQTAKGLQVIQTLDAWAPGDPALLSAKIMLLRQQGLKSYFLSIADVIDLTRYRLAHPAQRWLWTLQHLGWLRLMATLLLWGWALTLALRYRRVFRYLWEEPLMRRGMSPAATAILGALLVTFPVLLGLDPGVAALLWLWLLTPFLLPMELRATLIIVLMQLAHPLLTFAEPLARPQSGPTIVALQLQPQSMPMDQRAWMALAPADRAFLEGWRQLQLQDWSKAETTFRDLRASHPDRGIVLNNMGVARFQVGDVAGAKACFDEAAALLPGSAEVLLNQSVVAFKQMDSVLGEAKQDEASKAAPETYNRLLSANHARKEQRTFPIPLPDTPARAQALAAAGTWREPEAPAGAQLAILFNLLLPLVAAGAILARHRRSISAAHPSQCARCGEPFHTTDSGDTTVCSKCHHLFILKDGLHTESRKRKVDEVAAYQKSQRWLHKILIFLLPGSDLSFLGETWSGFLEYGFLCFAAGLVLATGRPPRYPGEIVAEPASVWLPVGVILLVVLFFRSWLKLLPRRS